MLFNHRQIERNPVKPPKSGANGMKSKSCYKRISLHVGRDDKTIF